ncbi:MAG: NAD(P)/FAD-dependent oxidoreductase, partial [Mycobacterium sp.]
MSKTVVVAGAGVGGLTVADRLRAVLPEHDRIVLVDPSFDGTLGLSLLWVLRGWRSPDEVRVRPTAAALPGGELITAAVESIDTA